MNLNPMFLLKEAQRILRLTRKPKQSEYLESVRVCAIGIILIGSIGFAIFIISRVLG
ncbi:MAG: protein translocase SEC61 complex subunit gamma [Candidatus Altiarchaeales archaeon]|nr:protein translocase SEC61 complex subunit gamma [Candidatus Altiarchaeales archaeon]